MYIEKDINICILDDPKTYKLGPCYILQMQYSRCVMSMSMCDWVIWST